MKWTIGRLLYFTKHTQWCDIHDGIPGWMLVHWERKKSRSPLRLFLDHWQQYDSAHIFQVTFDPEQLIPCPVPLVTDRVWTQISTKCLPSGQKPFLRNRREHLSFNVSKRAAHNESVTLNHLLDTVRMLLWLWPPAALGQLTLSKTLGGNEKHKQCNRLWERWHPPPPSFTHDLLWPVLWQHLILGFKHKVRAAEMYTIGEWVGFNDVNWAVTCSIIGHHNNLLCCAERAIWSTPVNLH